MDKTKLKLDLTKPGLLVESELQVCLCYSLEYLIDYLEDV